MFKDAEEYAWLLKKEQTDVASVDFLQNSSGS